MVVAAVASGALVAPAAASEKTVSPKTAEPVSPDRWMRSVCRSVLDWLETTDELDLRIFNAIEDLETDELAPRVARKRLVGASEKAVEATEELVKEVKSAGRPRVDGGKSIARDYVATLKEYRDVYRSSRDAFAEQKPRDQDAFIDGVTEIDDARWEDFKVIGLDPLEELRPVPELASAIDSESACGELDAFLRSFVSFAPVDVGDCVEILADFLDELEAVDCEEPHEGEVFVVEEYVGESSDPFPGNQALEAFIDDVCEGTRFEDYVGIDYASSELDFVYWLPTPEFWPLGDREIVCVLADSDGSLLEGSVKGTAR